jgi:pimeloyl-ACP methyl ester carboxylesterase
MRRGPYRRLGSRHVDTSYRSYVSERRRDLAPREGRIHPPQPDSCRRLALELGRIGRASVPAAGTTRSYRGPDAAPLRRARRPLASERRARIRGAVPYAELVIISGAGHMSNFERPEEFNAAITAKRRP